MKLVLVALMLVSGSAFAIDMPELNAQGAKVMEQIKAKAQDVMAACKEDKVKYCEKYTELNALKECLKKNKESLSAGCKSSLGLK
ncbi:MAG: hypothetical protein ACKOX6_10785 [Bdellovibrio sp.]